MIESEYYPKFVVRVRSVSETNEATLQAILARKLNSTFAKMEDEVRRIIDADSDLTGLDLHYHDVAPDGTETAVDRDYSAVRPQAR